MRNVSAFNESSSCFTPAWLEWIETYEGPSVPFLETGNRSGQLTPAVAMGQALIDRLQRAGIKFRVVE